MLVDMEDRSYICLIQDPEEIIKSREIRYTEAEAFSEITKPQASASFPHKRPE